MKEREESRMKGTRRIEVKREEERGKSFPVETSKTVLTTQQNRGCFVRLSLNVLDPKDFP